MSAQSPSYISTRSAEVILSDVRPIKLKAEALHSINVLLDETLYSILTASRSLATDKLKAALLKVLPTSLGKEALLEAEVELKAYWERTGSARSPSSARNGDSSDFDLQWSYELLRLKCEAYSTMNDSDEDAEAEKRLQQRMEGAGLAVPPSPTLLAPAALYLTAILEAICEHVLSNVSRVAARDSSRTLATVQDLFIALGEDDAVFGMFKSMKVYQHIEALSRSHHGPRRSKSFSSKSADKTATPRTSTSSPMGGESTAAPAKSRISSDSQKSTVVGSSESRRTSMEKVKGPKIFHTRTRSLSDKHEPATASLARSQSEIGINRELEFEEDEELQQEFDELMRSGATMKVSLTPDRLKTMEVYKQERIERERLNRRAGQSQDNGAVPVSVPPEVKRGVVNGRPPLRHVESIVEDEEESGSSNSTTSPPFQSNAAVRMRNTSFTAASTARRASDQRLRSISISNVPHPRHEDGIVRKATKSAWKVGLQNAAPKPPASGMPKRTRKVQQNRESMDLDEVMAGSDGEEDPSPTAATTTPKAAASTPTSPRQPHISKNAQDLIAFLEAGPPEEPSYNPSVNESVLSFESSKTRSGRLQRMMSRLTLGGSKESLNGGVEDTQKTLRILSRKNSKMTIVSSPPPSFKAGSLTTKRSTPSVANGSAYPNVVVATPPPRPPLQKNTLTSTPISISTSFTSPPVSIAHSSSTHTSTEDVSSVQQASSLSRRGTRKAVPHLDGSVVSPSSPIAHESIADGKPLLNGYRSARAADESRDSTPAPSPISPVARKPVLDGYPVKLETVDSILRPQGTNITSPTSTTESKSTHAHYKAESGYASRSASRSPLTPSERLPPPASPAPTISSSDAEDLRRLLTAASSADECRLLVDMFLVKNGLPLPDVSASEAAAALPAQPSLQDALALAQKGNDEVERGKQQQQQTPSPRESLSLNGSGDRSSNRQSNSSFVPAPVPTRVSISVGVDRRLSVTVPRLSIDNHILNLYRIYQSGLGLDSSG